MLKKSLLFALCIFLTKVSFSQDIITLKNGEELKSKVLNIGQKDITYKKFENQEGPSYTIQKSEVFFVKYQNGTKEMFNQISKFSGNSSNLGKDEEQEIADDVEKNYPAKKTGAGWTLATAIVLSPVVGLAPALLCNNAKPKVENLGIEDNSKLDDRNYVKAYQEEALKVKKKKVWKHYAIGSGAWLLLFLL